MYLRVNFSTLMCYLTLQDMLEGRNIAVLTELSYLLVYPEPSITFIPPIHRIYLKDYFKNHLKPTREEYTLLELETGYDFRDTYQRRLEVGLTV